MYQNTNPIPFTDHSLVFSMYKISDTSREKMLLHGHSRDIWTREKWARKSPVTAGCKGTAVSCAPFFPLICLPFLIHDTIQWLGSDHWLYTAFNEELWDTLNSGSVVKVL